jgi:predicted transcriptional regulator of viral defense system
MIAVAAPIEADLLRLRHEFLSMPALTLTVPQVARLLGVRTEYAAELLATLTADRMLMRVETGAYRRKLSS